MDPFLEMHWRDVHARLILYSANSIQRQLGDDLVARTEERLLVEVEDHLHRSIYPDLHVADHGLLEPAEAAVHSSVSTALLVEEVAPSPYKERFVEIIDPQGGRVITIVEFVSPSNKIDGEAREQYRQKQQECKDAGVNLVEIDLTRRGTRALLCPADAVAEEWHTTYEACVWRAWWLKGRGRFELYRMPLDQPLPTIAIPLRPTDKDVILELQPIVNQAYEDGRYGRTIRYDRPCEPPLTESQNKLLASLRGEASR